mgnify:CR=1 FL=1
MNVEKIVVGDLDTNCYIINIDDEYVIVDPGAEFQKIKDYLKGKKVVGCLVTHFHFDHIGALEEVISFYDLEINKINSKKFKFEIIKTPGHTNDSKTFYFKKAKVMFCGDFIFERGIGRTDLGGSDKDMQSSLEMISSYPDDITLYPGHGDKTTLGNEKKYFSYYY